MTPQTYHVVLHHLSPDAKMASGAQPDHELPATPIEKLRELLVALAATAAKLPAKSGASPEIRIKAGKDTLTVRVSEGQLRFVSWETKAGGVGLTVDQIIARVHLSAPRACTPPPRSPRNSRAGPRSPASSSPSSPSTAPPSGC